MLKETLTVTSAGSAQGNALRGRLVAVLFKRPASNAYDSGATATVSIVHEGFDDVPVLTGVSLNANAVWNPRSPVHGTDGAALAGQSTTHVLVDGRVKVAVSGGGTAKSGTFLLIFDR
jgi:hypothetical protein